MENNKYRILIHELFYPNEVEDFDDTEDEVSEQELEQMVQSVEHKLDLILLKIEASEAKDKIL